MNAFSCVDGSFGSQHSLPLIHRVSQLTLAFSCKSDKLCPFNKIMIVMFSCVQYKTMEQWTVYFGSKTLSKGPSMSSRTKFYL